ncbi:MAG: phosphate ABC transporter permease PstA [Rhodobacteraceae bacterium]|nr:phosphate ABC transporter permease PstA [Paracoccaceae bacterium]
MTSLIGQTPDMRRRRAAETRFQWYGRGAIFASLAFLAFMLWSIISGGLGAFFTTDLMLEVDLGVQNIDPENPAAANYRAIWRDAMKEHFPEVTTRKELRALYGMLGADAEYELEAHVMADPAIAGRKVKLPFRASDEVDMLLKGNIDRASPEDGRPMTDQEIAWVDHFAAAGDIERRFAWSFFTNGDSREPELAGILAALAGSFLTMLVCFCVSFPVAILAAIYLEEFAPKNRLSDLIEVNINNLAAVPSIVFGLLGLYMFLNTFGLPRSSPLAGGLVLSLMTLPTIIIAARASLRAVPPSIREAALGLGATPVQATFHHVAPLALPGILTGTIVGMAQALGETAPLLMIGMVAFIVDVPDSILEPATALPVQIFLWADAPQRAFVEKTSAAIIVLLIFLIIMNLAAILLRRRFEKRF